MGIKQTRLPPFEAILERRTADGRYGSIVPHGVDLVPAQQKLDILKVCIKKTGGTDRRHNRHYLLTV